MPKVIGVAKNKFRGHVRMYDASIQKYLEQQVITFVFSRNKCMKKLIAISQLNINLEILLYMNNYAGLGKNWRSINKYLEIH